MRIYLSKPHLSGLELAFVHEAFESNFIAPLGPQLDKFEDMVEQHLGLGYHCVALASGTAALHLALRIAGVGCDDEVWVSSMTFAGGVFPINYLSATPRFFDLSPETWTIDPQLLHEALSVASSKGRLPAAIVATDLYGQSAEIEKLETLAAHFNVKLIFDSAESLGATHLGGRKAGTGGDASIFSFNGNKIITTSGGGMLVTRHADWAEQARFLSTQARDPAPHYEHSTFGYNYRLSNISAAIGIGQFSVLNERVARRRQIFEIYKAELSYEGVEFMPEIPDTVGTRWLSTVTFDPNLLHVDREKIRCELLQNGIETRPLWKPMHLQKLYRNYEYHGRGFDEDLFQHGLCLPSSSCLLEIEQMEVIDRIKKLIKL